MARANGYDWKIGAPLPALGEHSAAKHEIFDRYIEAYIRTVTKNHLQRGLNLTIVDGFCGGGRYAFHRQEVDGSPLRMLAAVERADTALVEARVNGFDLKVDFVFVDENKDHVDFLRDILGQRGYGARIGGDIRVIHSTFEAACPEILARIRAKGRAHRSLFFLDQYGWSGVTLETVRQILGGLANPEVILTFMVDNLINLLNDRSADMQAMVALDLTREDVRGLIDQKGRAGWKRILQNTLYAHIQERTGADFYTPFFIHPEESNRDYWLLHLSKHHQAREEMGKVHWQLENTFEHFGGAGLNALGFDPRQDVRQGMFDYTFNDDARTRSSAALIEQIPRLLHANEAHMGRPVTKRDLFVARCNDTPVVADMVDQQLAMLRNEREIVIVGADGREKPRAQSFAWDDELRFVRQRTMFSTLGFRAA